MDKDWRKVIGKTGPVRLTDEEKKEQQKNYEAHKIEMEKCVNESLSFLKDYTTKHGCPCNCPEFESWTTWQPEPNSISFSPEQNELIANLWQLGCFRDKNPERRNVFFEDTPEYHRLPDAPVVVCSNCGVEWSCYRTEECKMGVYTHYLVKSESTARQMKLTTEIHVLLLDAGFEVTAWKQVEAESLGNNLFRIVSQNENPESEKWEFSTGDVVRCRKQQFSIERGLGLIAVEKIEEG